MEKSHKHYADLTITFILAFASAGTGAAQVVQSAFTRATFNRVIIIETDFPSPALGIHFKRAVVRTNMDIRQLFDKAIQAATENANYDYVITVQDSRDATRWLQITWDAVNVHYPFTETPDQLLLRLGLVLPNGMGVSDWAAMKSLTLWHSATNLETMTAFVRDYLVKAFGISTDVGSWQIKEITG